MEELNRIGIEEFKEKEKLNVVLILDDIRSMANVGSIFRTSDCFRIEKIYLCGITPVPPHREIEKTALGATESVEWVYFESAVDLLNKLKSEGVYIVSLEQVDQKTYLQDFFAPKDKKLALIMGNEVFGVNEELINLSDEVVEIPQFGTKHSFNVSVSVGIFLWDYLSKITGKTFV